MLLFLLLALEKKKKGKYILLFPSMTSMLWEIPNMTAPDLCSGCVFLSCSASDRSLTGNCYCDGCQVPGCGQALTFASFGYTSCQLMDSKCTDTKSTPKRKSKKREERTHKNNCWHFIHESKSGLMLVCFICWTLALKRCSDDFFFTFFFVLEWFFMLQ